MDMRTELFFLFMQSEQFLAIIGRIRRGIPESSKSFQLQYFFDDLHELRMLVHDLAEQYDLFRPVLQMGFRFLHYLLDGKIFLQSSGIRHDAVGAELIASG